MTELRKAAEMALEALDWLERRSMYQDLQMKETHEALRQALAQPEQEWDSRHPKAQALIGERARLRIELGLVERIVDDPYFKTTPSDMEYWGPLHDKLIEALTQPEQEPVAWMGVDSYGNVTKFRTNEFGGGIPLYTAPPKREWVGLTDEEIAEGQAGSWVDKQAWESAVWWAEAKLKEKNSA